jgi:N-acetylglucosaminyldiphosphoundecaprenol N-acetyl-beta-D-mannosaminyltransferase
MRTQSGIDGIPLVENALDAAVEEFLDHAVGRKVPLAYRFVNAYSLALADKDRRYHALLADHGVNLPDGMPVAWMLRRLGGPSCTQVRGPSFFTACLDRGRTYGLRHYFLGATPEVLACLEASVRRTFPGVAVVGVDSPPFRPLTTTERQQQDDRIRSAEPHVVWVGLGTPKQDFEAQRICDELEMCTAGVGAAFDFLAGTKREAPALLTRVGLEWVFRLVTEPRRLWRRYLFGNARFLAIVARDWKRRKRCVSP